VAGRIDPPPRSATDRAAAADLTAVSVLPVLLVDDRPENLRTLEAVLEPLGYPLQTATSGSEALRMLLERDYALILLDVRMPGLDGLETAQLIKGRARTRDTPIVFLTAASDEVSDIIRGYGVGAVDYVLKPFDAELLRSKVAVFAELEASRRALKRSEALLRGAFEAAPIGKTILNGDREIVRVNPAFARLLDHTTAELEGAAIREFCHPEDRDALAAALDQVTDFERSAIAQASVDLRLTTGHGTDVWVGLVASSIEPGELEEPLVLVQWVDLSARLRAAQASGELMLEQAARSQAEELAEHLNKLQRFASATEAMSLSELLAEIAIGLGELFEAEVAEVQLDQPDDGPVVVRAAGGHVLGENDALAFAGTDVWADSPLLIEREQVGAVRVARGPARSFSADERSLLRDAAERAALSIRRAQLHDHEHRIAVELQRGLLPKDLPAVDGIEIAAHYQAAGAAAKVGGDWYDAFALPGGRLGVVVGDVAGRGIAAASTMGQLRSVIRAFALADDQNRSPGEVLTRVSRHHAALGSQELFTVIYAICDPRKGRLSWANAGHPAPILRSAGGESGYLERGEGLIGIKDSAYENRQEVIGSGDTLILFTDGLIERRGEPLDAGVERLERAVSLGPESPQALCEHILDELLVSEEQLQDDVTAVVVRIA
jgi:PAS domain S-box-containing protein